MDRLTGVSNRTALDALFERYEMHPQSFEHLNLIVVDIDNFKTVNDCYGHFWVTLAIPLQLLCF